MPTAPPARRNARPARPQPASCCSSCRTLGAACAGSSSAADRTPRSTTTHHRGRRRRVEPGRTHRFRTATRPPTAAEAALVAPAPTTSTSPRRRRTRRRSSCCSTGTARAAAGQAAYLKLARGDRRAGHAPRDPRRHAERAGEAVLERDRCVLRGPAHRRRRLRVPAGDRRRRRRPPRGRPEPDLLRRAQQRRLHVVPDGVRPRRRGGRDREPRGRDVGRTARCRPATAVSVLEIHGTATSSSSTTAVRTSAGGTPGAEQTVEDLGRLRRLCPLTPDDPDAGTARDRGRTVRRPP